MQPALIRFLSRRRNRVGATVVAIVVVVGAGGAAVLAANHDPNSHYRTATVGYAQVAETLQLTGQVASAHSVAAAFQVSGTVARVLVALGDRVGKGQALAALDTTDLDSAVTSAKDALARARQQLADDLSAQSSGSSSTASQPASGSTGSGRSGAPSSGQDPSVTAARKAVTTVQTALLAQYETVTTAQSASAAAADAAQHACAPFLAATLDSDTTMDTATAHRSADTKNRTRTHPQAGTDGAAGGAGDQLGAVQQLLTQCQQALGAQVAAQQEVTTDQGVLTQRASALNDAVTALLKALAAAPGGAVPSSTAAASQSRALVGGTSSKTSVTITAEQILADRAATDSADAKLAVAKQDLSLAKLSSPIDGTVVAVGLAQGDRVTAGSASAAITVQGDGYVVPLTVPLSKIAKVAVGQSAEVVLPAFAATYPASVSAIGVLNVSQTSTPSYAVTLALDSGTDAIRIGATAQATVTLSATDSALSVPTSAVTLTTTGATVLVLRDGVPTTVTVQVGAVGAERTQILGGLSQGETVVVADLTASSTSDDTTTGGLTNLVRAPDGRGGTGFVGGPGGR